MEKLLNLSAVKFNLDAHCSITTHGIHTAMGYSRLQSLHEVGIRHTHVVKQLAETHRNLGALAFLHDTQLALDHYRKSTVLDAEDPDGWTQLGHLLMLTGELLEAKSAYQQLLRLASSADDGRVLQAVAYGNLGNVHEIRGELDQARASRRQSLQLFREIGPPSSVQVQGSEVQRYEIVRER